MESISGASDFARRIEIALARELDYGDRLKRPGYVNAPVETDAHAAVLALFGWKHPEPESPSGISLLLTRRTETVESHKGQMAFPGGRCEPDERARELYVETALRETEEEVGIAPSEVQVLGRLPGLSTATGYWVWPFVGVLKQPMEKVTLRLNAAEIAELVWIPWEVLIHPTTYRQETFERGPIRFLTDVYQVGEHRIWGATGAMIHNLVQRMATRD